MILIKENIQQTIMFQILKAPGFLSITLPFLKSFGYGKKNLTDLIACHEEIISFSIRKPGEYTYIPYITLAWKTKEFIIGKPRGWSEEAEVIDLIPGDLFNLLEVKTEKYIVYYSRGHVKKKAGRLEFTEPAWIYQAPDAGPGDFYLQWVPMYARDGSFQYPGPVLDSMYTLIEDLNKSRCEYNNSLST